MILGYDFSSDPTVFFITVSRVRIIRDRLHPASDLGIEGNKLEPRVGLFSHS